MVCFWAFCFALLKPGFEPQKIDNIIILNIIKICDYVSVKKKFFCADTNSLIALWHPAEV